MWHLFSLSTPATPILALPFFGRLEWNLVLQSLTSTWAASESARTVHGPKIMQLTQILTGIRSPHALAVLFVFQYPCTLIMLWYVLAICPFAAPAFAQSNGMNMAMDGPMNLAVGRMLPYFHFSPGDVVWFQGWVPSSIGAMIGTCIGLFLLGILERWLAACQGMAKWHWNNRAMNMAMDKSSLQTPKRSIPPFIPSYEITRGVMFTAHALLRYLLMLVVMTFQLAFLFSIVIGSGVGETLFGRFSFSDDGHH